MNKWLVALCLSTLSLSASDQPLSDYRVVLDPIQRTQLYPEISARVTQVNKRFGESFEEGETLIRFEQRVAEGEAARALAEFERRKAAVDAQRELYRERVTSLVELREAEAALAAARADLIAANTTLEATLVAAPYAGKVVEVLIEEHEIPQGGRPLVEIVDDSVLVAKLLVPSRYLTELYEGRALELVLDETGQSVNALIARVGSVIDPSSSTVQIEAEVDNRDGKLRAGMSGAVHWR